MTAINPMEYIYSGPVNRYMAQELLLTFRWALGIPIITNIIIIIMVL